MTKRTPIDTSMLPYGKPERVRDRKYLNSFKDRECIVCGTRETVVAAHIRTGNEGGMGLKPGDDLTFPLCHTHHMDQEANPGITWWIENLPFGVLFRGVKLVAKTKYRSWKNG